MKTFITNWLRQRARQRTYRKREKQRQAEHKAWLRQANEKAMEYIKLHYYDKIEADIDRQVNGLATPRVEIKGPHGKMALRAALRRLYPARYYYIADEGDCLRVYWRSW